MKDRSDDPSHNERTLLPRRYISLIENEQLGGSTMKDQSDDLLKQYEGISCIAGKYCHYEGNVHWWYKQLIIENNININLCSHAISSVCNNNFINSHGQEVLPHRWQDGRQGLPSN